MNRSLGSAVRFAVGVAAEGAALATCFPAEAATTVYELAQVTHFHGLAVAPAETSRLYLATHDGLFVVEADGTANPLSDRRDDLTGFTPHPTKASILYASGHPAGGGNLGFIASGDGGTSWCQLGRGVGGPVDFHPIEVSPADTNTIYGASAGNLQVSKDGGHTWEVVGATPAGLMDLAASSRDPGTLYAATRDGLLKSQDGGRTWQDAYWLRQPATMVHVTTEGAVYAFVVGTGLISTVEPKPSWQRVSEHGFGDNLLLHFAVDPSRPSELYAISFDLQSKIQAVLASDDAGKTWAPLGSRIP
jgi:photosystem II stability/assembly factor-like uncharacterized protein